MERYKEYKDSGVKWIGEIPSHWELRRIKYIFTELKEKSENGLETPLSLSKDSGIIPFDEKKNKTMESASYVGGKIVHKGEIVFNRFKARLFAVSGYDGIVSSDYAVYKCRDLASPKYMVRLFGTEMYRDAFNRKASGIGDGFSRLYSDDLFAMFSVFPPLYEQEIIVKYIESISSKIDAYVAEKEEEIQLLQELKQKTIADAVTKGLNPDVKMKDSGISWIGEIPEHWFQYRFATLFKEKSICNYVNEELLSVYLDRGVIKFSEDNSRRTNPTSKDLSKYQLVDIGDFVLNNQQAWRGSVGVSKYRGIISPAYFIFSMSPKIDREFANYLLRSTSYVAYYFVCSKGIGSIQRNLDWGALKQKKIAIPPIDEQHAIVAYIEEKCQKIDTLMSELQVEIDYMKEYKQRLIADCVTGQVNVQNIKI